MNMLEVARMPNFLYIGPDKAGSTWIYKVLSWHPDVYMTPAKDLYFFDRYYDKGLAWYLKHFKGATYEQIVGEVSHDYLYSKEACERIAKTLPEVKLMVCLREPIDRAFSAYLYLLKHGLFRGRFEDAIEQVPEIIERSRYAKYLRPYLEIFGKERIHVGVFDELKSNPKFFSKKLFEFLGVKILEIPDHLCDKVLPASRPRSALLAKIVKKAALISRELGLSTWVGYVKRSPLVQYLLYQPYDENKKPVPNKDTIVYLKNLFASEVRDLDLLLDSNFKELWGYLKPSDQIRRGG